MLAIMCVFSSMVVVRIRCIVWLGGGCSHVFALVSTVIEPNPCQCC